MGGYTRTVSGQRLGKHVPVARQQMLNDPTVGPQQLKSCVFYVVRADVISKGKGEFSQFCTGGCEETT
jgi:hypothetical protein